MYWLGAENIKEFYSTALGAIVCRKIRNKIANIWPEIHGDKNSLSIAGIGYTGPYLIPFLDKSKSSPKPIAICPSGQGLVNWPKDKKQNLSLSSMETDLPFEDASIDRIIVIHALEYTSAPFLMMKEIWRVLAPEGKVLIIVPNRLSIWARSSNTPFGHGHPFFSYQLKELLEETMFSPRTVDKELFISPLKSRIMLKTSDLLWGPVTKLIGGGGALIAEAEKQIYAPNLKKEKFRKYVRKETIIPNPA